MGAVNSLETTPDPTTPAIENILNREQFITAQSKKDQELLTIIRAQLDNHIKYSPNLQALYKKFNFDPVKIQNIADVSPLPVQMFKKFDLRTCPEEDIIRILNSSATTTGVPSKIYVDKTTAFRQTHGLTVTVKNFIGKERKPYLVIDEDVNKGKTVKLTARGAAIRGFANYAKTTTYVMDNVDEELVLNKERLQEFCEKYQDQEVLVFGFTYIIWTRFIKELKKEGLKLQLPKMKLLHGGGWKKLIEQAVSKETFNQTVAEYFGTNPANIIDYYGMVEQLGVVFLDCEYGNKHVPDFADIIIRDFYSMEEVPTGNDGLIECVSILPTSYPGQALLTEDVGKILGIDDCPCGRKGKYFTFVSRAEKAEIRGCGDTFAERAHDTNKPQEGGITKVSLAAAHNIDNRKDEWDW